MLVHNIKGVKFSSILELIQMDKSIFCFNILHIQVTFHDLKCLLSLNES